MLDIGFGEMMIIGVLAIVIVGPERLPEMMRFLGRQYGKLMRTSNELRRAFFMEADRAEAEARAADMKARREDAKKRAEEARARALAERAALTSAPPAPPAEGPPPTPSMEPSPAPTMEPPPPPAEERP
jgi:sec-independent protein translocase protein TatB